MNAAAIALGMQAEVLLLDRDIAKLRHADAIYQGHCQTVASNTYEIERAISDADLVIGAVLVPGAKAPKLVTNEQVSRMKPGSVLVDISIDQGGCFEDSRPTTHADPTYQVHNSVFYCVANMPGAVPHTSTYALTNVTLPYAVELADQGWREALRGEHAARARPQHPRRRGHLRAGRGGARVRVGRRLETVLRLTHAAAVASTALVGWLSGWCCSPRSSPPPGRHRHPLPAREDGSRRRCAPAAGPQDAATVAAYLSGDAAPASGGGELAGPVLAAAAGRPRRPSRSRRSTRRSPPWPPSAARARR